MCRGGTWCDCQHRDPTLPRELQQQLVRDIASKIVERDKELLERLKEGGD